MTGFRRILFGTDFSEGARQALEMAARLARAAGGRIEAVHVLPLNELERPQAEKEMPRAVPAAFDDVVSSREIIKSLTPDLGLIEAAQKRGSDLIVVGTHGRTGLQHVLLGSVAERVVQHAPCAVLTVRTRKSAVVRIARVLCPVDFSEPALAARAQAEELARAFGAELVLAHVVEPIVFPVVYGEPPVAPEVYETRVIAKADAALEPLAAELRGRGVKARHVVASGLASGRIVALVEDEAIDLVVMGTHGLTGVEHALLGSTAERVVRKCPCPVLTVKAKKQG